MRKSNTTYLARAIVFFIACIAAITSPARALANGKIGNIAYSVTSSPNALDANHFSMSASDLGGRVGAFPTMTAMFQGSCSQILAVQVLLINVPKPRLEDFRISRSSRDLPMQELLQVTGRVLLERCDSVQVVRVTIANFGYEGTLTRAGGWVLQDGYVATEFDVNAKVEIRAEDSTERLRVLHRGNCEAEPKLLLEPVQRAATSRSDALLYDYASLASNAAAKYAQQCRNVQSVSFALGLMPENWFCARPGDCFLEAKLVDGRWVTGFDQLKRRKNENPIVDFYDMAEVLAAGNFDVLKDYQVFFGFFVWSYFDSYSEACKSYIRQPVGRVTRYTTVKRDGNGNVVSEESNESSPIFVESANAWAYDAHESGMRAYLLRNLMRSTSTGISGGFNSGVEATKEVAANVSQMKKLLVGKCTDDRVLTMQQNLLNYVGGKPPVTGKYTTDKKPITEYADVTMSAPEFTKAYLADRAERFKTAAQPKRTESAKPPVSNSNSTNPAPSPPALDLATLQRQYVEEVTKLEQDYRTQMQGANVLERLKFEAELRYKKLILEREYRENVKRAQ